MGTKVSGGPAVCISAQKGSNSLSGRQPRFLLLRSYCLPNTPRHILEDRNLDIQWWENLKCHFEKVLEKYISTLLHQRIAMSLTSDRRMEQTVSILVTETEKSSIRAYSYDGNKQNGGTNDNCEWDLGSIETSPNSIKFLLIVKRVVSWKVGETSWAGERLSASQEGLCWIE